MHHGRMSANDAVAGDDNERFLLAVNATRRIINQCRAHTESTLKLVKKRIDQPAPSSACALDNARADQGIHVGARKQRVDYVSTASNAILTHLRGLTVLFEHDTFLPIPAVSIARSVAETAASCSWLLHPGLTPEDRDARAYASLFRAVQDSIPRSLSTDAGRTDQLKQRVLSQLATEGVRVTYETDRKGNLTDRVDQVLVKNAHAKTKYRYTDRVQNEIPPIAALYSGLSGIAHGEQMHLASSWDTPDTHARLIGIVVLRSIETWSHVVHTWLGSEPSRFTNPQDLQNLLRSIPSDLVAEFEAEAARTASAT